MKTNERMARATVVNIAKIKGNRHIYKFKCECSDCDADGRLELKADETGQFECPAGCGAVYIEYRDLKGYALKAVILPHYDKV